MAGSAIPITGHGLARARSPASGWSAIRASTSYPTASSPRTPAPSSSIRSNADPVGNPDWWHYKRRHFGGDDGIEFIEVERLVPLFDRNLRATHLNVVLTETDIALSLFIR